MNYKLFLLLLLFPLSFNAQVKKVKAKIINPGSLYSTYDFTADVGLLKPAIKLQGGTAILSDIIKYSTEANWPAGMSDLDSRLSNKASIMKYNAYKIVKTQDYCILLIPASENKHMETKLRPAQDIYFVMELQGAEFEGNNPALIKEKENVSYEEFEEDEEDGALQAYIVNPGDLYSTFDLANNASAKDLLITSGILSAEEFKELASKCTEKSWPAGISTLTARLAAAEKIKSYFTYYLLEFGDEYEYTLLWIPLEENSHMPENMQPTDSGGFYFVIKSSGVLLEDEGY